MATEAQQLRHSLPAAGNLSASQYCGVTINSSGQIAIVGADVPAVGILQDKPDAAGKAGAFCFSGVSKVLCGGSITTGGRFVFNSSGKAVAAGSSDANVMGWMLEDGADGKISTCLFQPTGTA